MAVFVAFFVTLNITHFYWLESAVLHKHHVKNHSEANHSSSGEVTYIVCGFVCLTRKTLAIHNFLNHLRSRISTDRKEVGASEASPSPTPLPLRTLRDHARSEADYMLQK